MIESNRMINVDPQAWEVMVAHAEAKFPNECCGAMIGTHRRRREARHASAEPMENAYRGRAGRPL